MIKYQDLVQHIIKQIGEETFVRELEGIIRKHEAITRRKRKASRVDVCYQYLMNMYNRGDVITPLHVANVVRPYYLSQASIYRLVEKLQKMSFHIKAVYVLEELKKQRWGIY